MNADRYRTVFGTTDRACFVLRNLTRRPLHVQHASRISFWLLLLVLLGIACPDLPAAAVDALPKAAPDDRVEFVLAQNEMARARIKSGVYHYEEQCGEELSDPPDKSQVHTGTVYFKGRFRLRTQVDMVKLAPSADAAPTSSKEQETRSVIGPTCVGMWLVGHPLGEQFEHPSPEAMRQEVKDRLLMLTGEDFLGYGFGYGLQSLRAYHNGSPAERCSWRVEEVLATDGNVLLHLRRYFKPDGKEAFPSSDFTLDPQRGFLVTASRVYQPDGTLYSTEDHLVEDATGNGDWLPVSTDERVFKNTGKTSWHRKLKLRFERVNTAMDDSLFGIASLKFPNGLLVKHVDADGKEEPYISLDGNPLPQEITIRAETTKGRIESLASVDSLRDEHSVNGSTKPSADSTASSPSRREAAPWAICIVSGVAIAVMLLVVRSRLHRTNRG